MAKKTASGPLIANAKARYQTLQTSRNTALQRARDNSKLTIPGLVPEDGQDANASFEQPYQSLGARGTNNLASWLLVTQFPPDTPFARLTVHEDVAQSLGSKLTAVKEGLARISSKAQLLVESSAARPILMEVFRHLVVAGNVLLYQPLDGSTPRMYRLDQYVVSRDETGGFIEIVVKEQVYPSTLTDEVRAFCKVEWNPAEEREKIVDLYTHIRREPGKGDLVSYQEINQIIVPQSEGTQPYDSRGWLALRWQAVPGSDYGRAMISEYVGDLLSLEDLSKAIVQFAAVASRIIHVVDPNAMVDIEELTAAETGDFISGVRDKIGTIQLEKAQDFQIANAVAERLEQRLSHAFMLRQGTMRDAERVTAEEIRAVAQELENVLGGTYTVLSAELQMPYMKRLVYILQKQGEAPDLPPEVVPAVITGFAAMGRSHSATRLKEFLKDVSDTFGPTGIQQLNAEEILLRLAESYGIEAVDAIIKTSDQMDQENQTNMANQAAMAAAPNIAKGAVDAMNAPAEETEMPTNV